MGLIDADLLQEVLAKEPMENRTYLRANEIVVDMPTAYDVDKAIEELRDLLWDCYTDSGVGIDRETGFKAYEREMERIVRQNRR